MAFCITSCNQIDNSDPVVGVYTCIPDINVSSSERSGIIFGAMRDAALKATRQYDIRSSAGDNAAVSVAEGVAAQYKDQANKKIVISVVFQPGNAMGEAEKSRSSLRVSRLRFSFWGLLIAALRKQSVDCFGDDSGKVYSRNRC